MTEKDKERIKKLFNAKTRVEYGYWGRLWKKAQLAWKLFRSETAILIKVTVHDDVDEHDAKGVVSELEIIGLPPHVVVKLLREGADNIEGRIRQFEEGPGAMPTELRDLVENFKEQITQARRNIDDDENKPSNNPFLR